MTHTRHRARTRAAVIAYLLAVAPPIHHAAAQEVHAGGVWMDVSAGYGWNAAAEPRGGNGMGHLTRLGFGYTIGSTVRAGFGVAAWASGPFPAIGGTAAWNVTADVVVNTRSTLLGPHLRLGAGLGVADRLDETRNRTTGDYGLGVTMGADWGVFQLHRAYVGVGAQWMLQALGARPGSPSVNHVLGLMMVVAIP